LSLKPKAIRFGIEVVIIWAVFLIALSLTSVEYTQMLLLVTFMISLVIAGMMEGHRSGLFHQGHFPMLAGIVLVLTGVSLIYGTWDFSYMNDDGTTGHKEKWYDFTPVEQGIYIFMVIAGILSFITGAKMALQNQYFWGNITNRGRR